MSQRRGRDFLTDAYRLSGPSVIMSGGPSFAREATEAEPPPSKPKIPLGFAPNLRECPKCPDDGCDLACCWDKPEPLLWDGDGA